MVISENFTSKFLDGMKGLHQIKITLCIYYLMYSMKYTMKSDFSYQNIIYIYIISLNRRRRLGTILASEASHQTFRYSASYIEKFQTFSTFINLIPSR